MDPILNYGCEWWQLSDKEKKMIETVEMDFLRTACNISRMQNVRNENLYERKQGADLQQQKEYNPDSCCGNCRVGKLLMLHLY